MAAPTPASARVTPTDWKEDQGYPIFIVFAANPGVNFWEITVKPPGVDGGDAIETSTQFNLHVHTKRARFLKMITDSGAKVQIAAGSLNACYNLVNVETTVTIIFPDGATYCFYGYLKSFILGDFAEGEKPTGDIVVVATNWDVTNSVEAVPVYNAKTGTSA